MSGKTNFCGCCGRRTIYSEWCKPCQSHIDRRKTFWDATYLAQHGVDCPYTNMREADADDPDVDANTFSPAYR